MDLSIIIVNYNGMNYLPGCLQSIKRHATCSHEVILVDNGSTDGSLDYMKNEQKDVILVPMKENGGFARGNNRGAEMARGKLLLFLNNDTLLLTSLNEAISLFNDKQTGAVGCKMSFDGGSFQPSIGYAHTPSRIVLSWLGLERFDCAPALFKKFDTNEANYRTERNMIAWVSGAFLMTRRALWEELKGFDERFFMYMEDVDFCKRLLEKKYIIAYTPHVEIVHYMGGGKKRLNAHALKYTMDSYMVFLQKHYGLLSARMVQMSLSAIMTVRAILFTLMRFSSANPERDEMIVAYHDAAASLREAYEKVKADFGY